ncbi:hypothetical protein IGI04_025799 [Brassica rapa subsp. trilocularis]|uniref:Reverse transcriptase Ty1/copia-type domain-containing protein n=1 Tax=Brassica rapa subsp. trilocularis TaxID=1813537 RepID=A0ABQ7KUE8_BRACM|nr:hypothetical protein IGI04_025799 [Brassica rapa subsp. trilocularis]
MLHKILSKVAITNIRDFGCAKVSFPGLKCYQLGNPEAIYLQGERGCLLAKYVDDMMNLAFSVDHRGLVHNYHDFTREYVDRMYHMITS